MLFWKRVAVETLMCYLKSGAKNISHSNPCGEKMGSRLKIYPVKNYDSLFHNRQHILASRIAFAEKKQTMGMCYSYANGSGIEPSFTFTQSI